MKPHLSNQLPPLLSAFKVNHKFDEFTIPAFHSIDRIMQLPMVRTPFP